jgi:ATPase family associated with various cellular activities (AAA)
MDTPSCKISWAEANQVYLVAEFARIQNLLSSNFTVGAEQESAKVRSAPEEPPAIDRLAVLFELSNFERDLLLLCAGVEMDAALAARCATANGHARRSDVTFSLAMAALPNPHWSALAPSAPLRRFRLIEMEPGHGVTSAPLRIDERILYYLAGLNQLDQRLESILYRKSQSGWLSEEHHRLVTEMFLPEIGRKPAATVLHLCGDDPAGQESIVALITHRAGRQLFVLRMDDTPAAGAELDQFVQLWTREALLLSASLLLQWESEAPSPAARMLAERLPGTPIIASRDPLRLHRAVQRYEVNKPDPCGQKQLWREVLGPGAGDLNGILDEVSQQFRLSAETIASIGASAAVSKEEAPDRRRIATRLWNACRSSSRPRLDGLVERILPSAGWDDLVLPVMQKQTLRQLAAQSRQRMMVYETWGFAAKGRRGLGLSALFSGPSGTGKTLAAEVLAGELSLDLYRIDLSSVVSKYIGETEKNLKQVFDAAETGGVVLLFDEADALFGKRGEVKDSHDRYANIEVSYLLQRMESFQGLAILTTNLKSSLDKAFQRRLRFTIDFPFPDATQREAIWSRVFPAQTPTKDLQPDRLAKLNMTGGNIRNIALNAAFLAAEAGASVEMAHVLQATRMEAVKIERPLSETEVRGWV